VVDQGDCLFHFCTPSAARRGSAADRHYMARDCGAFRMEGERKMADDPEAPAWAAKRLLRAARAGTLASSAAGQPFASLVTPACAPDSSILLLLSELSEHTR